MPSGEKGTWEELVRIWKASDLTSLKSKGVWGMYVVLIQ